MDRRAAFWNRLAKRYAAQPISDEAAYRRKLEITRRYLRPDMEVLEFGCGTGGTARIHAPHVRRYRAVDISDAMIGIARDKAPVPDNLEFEVAEFDTMEITPGSLDMVLGLSILHLVPDPRATIAKVHQALKPGGYFTSSSACLGGSWLFRALAPAGRALGLMPPVSFFSRDDLRAMMTGAGFEIVEDWHPGGNAALFLVVKKPG